LSLLEFGLKLIKLRCDVGDVHDYSSITTTGSLVHSVIPSRVCDSITSETQRFFCMLMMKVVDELMEGDDE
jgi:hypothetical protein